MAMDHSEDYVLIAVTQSFRGGPKTMSFERFSEFVDICNELENKILYFEVFPGSDPEANIVLNPVWSLGEPDSQTPYILFILELKNKYLSSITKLEEVE